MTQDNFNNQEIQQPVQDNTPDLKELLFMCLSNWKWFVLSVIVCLGVACLHILRTPAVYTRNASVMMKDDKKSGNFTGEISEAFSNMGIAASSYNVLNEMNAMKSPSNVMDVVRRLELYMSYKTKGTFHDVTLYGMDLPIHVELLDVPETRYAALTLSLETDSLYTVSQMKVKDEEFETTVKGACGDTICSPIGRILVTKAPSVADWAGDIMVSHAPIRNAARSCSGRLSIDLADKNATILNIGYQDVSVQRADDFINALLDVYNTKWIQDKNQIAVSTSIFINERLALIEEELGEVDSDISAYKSEHLIPDIHEASRMYMSQANKAEATEVELNNQVYMAKYIKDYLTSSDDLKLIPSISGIGSSSIGSQITTYNELLLKRNSSLASSSMNNPLVVDMDNRLRAMRTAIVTSIDNELVTLQKQINSQRNYGSKATSQIASNPDQAKYLLNVERQQKVKEAIYLFLLQKREENELSQAFTAYNTRIIAPPYGGDAPSSPRKSMILLVALVLGLAIPFGILYLNMMLDTTLKSRSDIEGKVTIPFLGEIPLCGKQSRKKAIRLIRRGKSPASEIVVHKGNRNHANEAFRMLRTKVEFLTGSGSGNVIVVTSYNAGSGKSFISNNLASVLAIKDKKVMIVDCDLRKAAISRFYGKPAKGLSDYLGGYMDSIDECIIQSPEFESLSIIPVGTIPPNPTELISEPRFAELISDLRTRYDYIFLDCPPVEIVADTSIIEQNCDRVLFVARAGLLQRVLVDRLEEEYRQGRYRNLCMVLNGTELGSRRYSYGYRYGYGSYHEKDSKGYYAKE